MGPICLISQGRFEQPVRPCDYALYKFTFIIIIVIGRMRPPVSISILSFELTELTSDLDFCMHMGHDHRSPEIESQ